MNDPIVSVTDLVKHYGSNTVLNKINFEVGAGEVFGLLGPNGAGKTTTLECLEGLRKPNGGTLQIAGCDPQTQEHSLRSLLGVQLQSSALPDSIKVSEALQLFCSWHGVAQRDDLIEKFGITPFLTKQFKQLSTGQKRRLLLVLALVNSPRVLILDEPTAGLDVQSRAQLHDEIRRIKQQGITVLLATHDMAEAEQLCDRIAIILNGKIAFSGTPQEVTAAGNGQTKITLRTAHGSLSASEAFSGTTFVQEKEGYLEWKTRDVAEAVTQILGKVKAANDTVEDLRVERPSLEERFLELVEGN
jgi:ABC-2 type transport system ATP-binding protein